MELVISLYGLSVVVNVFLFMLLNKYAVQTQNEEIEKFILVLFPLFSIMGSMLWILMAWGYLINAKLKNNRLRSN